MNGSIRDYAIGGGDSNDFSENSTRTDIKDNNSPIGNGAEFKCAVFYLDNATDLETYNELITKLYSNSKKHRILCDDHNFTREGAVINVVKYINLRGAKDKEDESTTSKKETNVSHMDMLRAADQSGEHKIFKDGEEENAKDK